MKVCEEKGCNSPQFGGGKCKYHQFKRHMRGGDLFKQKPRQKAPPKESKKRKVENKHYLIRIKEFWDNAVNNGTNQCFFCGETMEHKEDIHHALGRGAFLLEEEFWVLAHRTCHNRFHAAAIEFLMRQPWWKGFLSRLEKKSTQAYHIVLNRINKAELEFD